MKMQKLMVLVIIHLIMIMPAFGQTPTQTDDPTIYFNGIYISDKGIEAESSGLYYRGAIWIKTKLPEAYETCKKIGWKFNKIYNCWHPADKRISVNFLANGRGLIYKIEIRTFFEEFEAIDFKAQLEENQLEGRFSFIKCKIWNIDKDRYNKKFKDLLISPVSMLIEIGFDSQQEFLLNVLNGMNDKN